MKTRLLVMVGMMISTTIFAQKSTSGVERMKRELMLTDEQYASVRKIDSDYAKKRIEQRSKADLRRLEEREKMRDLRLERERDMRKVFTPDQSKKWDEYRAAQKSRYEFAKRKGKHGGHYHKHFRKDKHERKDPRDFNKKG